MAGVSRRRNHPNGAPTRPQHPWTYRSENYAYDDAFHTPDQQQRRQQAEYDDHDNENREDDLQEDWHFEGGPSPIPRRNSREYGDDLQLNTRINGMIHRQSDPAEDGEEGEEEGEEGYMLQQAIKKNAPSQQQQSVTEFARSQFRRRNRLETRLGELQRDVAALTVKLRSNSNRSSSTGGGEKMVTDKKSMMPLQEIDLDSARLNNMRNKQLSPTTTTKKKPARSTEKLHSRLNTSDQSTGKSSRTTHNTSLRTMRELHSVTTERDQLKFELEKTKRLLTTMQKKLGEALKCKQAYEKLKVHCDSLQESLDLSEKIRIRQKKLLQQLQKNQQQQLLDITQAASSTKVRMKSTTVKTKKKSAPNKTMETPPPPPPPLSRSSTNRDMPQQSYELRSIPLKAQSGYNILDSFVNSPQNANGTAINPKPSEEDQFAAAVRFRLQQSSDHARISNGTRTSPDFDALLQAIHPPPYEYYVQKHGRTQTGQVSRPSQESVLQKTSRLRSQTHALSTSTNLMKRSPVKKRTNHFLAPTAASLNRMQSIQRRIEHRRPFLETMLTALVEQAYVALVEVVQTTAVTRKVLMRPPFTFLHKLLVETLSEYGIFTHQQLQFTALVTKEDKSAFLTRAIAFVTFGMSNIKEKRISCLLLVSPVKVLAGIAVDDTLEFLLQLCVLCKSSDREAKLAAAHEVLHKGDSQLYTTGVTFRKGIVLIQAIIRAFIKRRVGARRASQIGPPVYNPLGPLSMTIGTKFLKELADGRICNGIIKDIRNTIYELSYEQDPAVHEEVDAIEMKIILEESHRLSMLREFAVLTTKDTDDADISLIGLPDLSLPLAGIEDGTNEPTKPRLIRLFSAQEVDGFPIPKKTRPYLARSKSHQYSQSVSFTADAEQRGQRQAQRQERRGQNLERLTNCDNILSSAVVKNATNQTPENGERSTATQQSMENEQCEKPWQASLKKILAYGQETQEQHSVIPFDASHKQVHSSRKSSRATEGGNNKPAVKSTHTPIFPKLGIPGTKPIAPVAIKSSMSKRALVYPTSAFKQHVQLKHDKSSLSIDAAYNQGSPAICRANSIPASRIRDQRSDSFGVLPESAVDSAFSGTYQTTDQKTQEKIALFREIVCRMDGYMKRKHLRVIDLFRFCDADGNGSISPQEMLDTLSQMEIQLSKEQGQDFINYIDRDGNGSIDIDEFEELVRVARRNEAQRDQLKKELNHGRKLHSVDKPAGKYRAFVKHKQRICDEFKASEMTDEGTLTMAQLRTLLLRLEIPGIDEVLVSRLIARCQATIAGGTTAHPSSTAGASSMSTPSGSANPSAVISLQQFIQVLDDLEWTKKSNRFLDQSWLSQFDSQLERTRREFELL